MTVSARQAWAVDTVEFRPDDQLLELGCGHGVAASLVCDRLDSGSYLGLDRSEKMIQAAVARNEHHVRSGKACFVETSVAGAGPEAHFDCVFAIHFPPLLRGDPSSELEVIRKHLTEEGLLWVVFQPLSADHMPRSIHAVQERLQRGSYETVKVVRGKPAGNPAAAVVGRPI